VKLLLDKGAQANVRNNENKMAYQLAKDPETAALLRSASKNEFLSLVAVDSICYNTEIHCSIT